REASNPRIFGVSLISLGLNFQRNCKQHGMAKLLYQGGLSLWQDIQRIENGIPIIRGLIGLAEAAAIQGKGDRSGWLFSAADHLTPSSGFYRDDLNERVSQTREPLDAATKTAFDTGWAEGQTATLEQAVQKALQEAV